MSNNILLWIKGNYEKLILGILVILLIMISLRLFSRVDIEKELQGYEVKIKPPKTPSTQLESIYDDKDLERYLAVKPFEQYQSLADRAMFFPVETKSPSIPSAPEMNLECTGVISDTNGILTATFKNPQTGKTYKAKETEKIENWTVVSITRDIVVLSGNDKQYRLNPPTVTMPFKLTGIMPLETGFQAMLQSESTKKTYFVNVGDEAENWKVLSIDEKKVIISKSDAGKYELQGEVSSNV